ncbi:MAG: choline dehydrogenase, partial [Rhodospirillaceae bacterium]|nr:choline dehydrogenase [Rhodospirillaceae bacterium]
MSETGFDYVIVGGGTAGGVLAARLTEDPSVRVLVLEAGPDHRSLMMRIPAGVVGLYQAGKYHWDYVAEPEEHAGGKVLPYKMGKILGGSSSINAMHWVRGAPAVYDGWAAAGCTGWSYAEVEKIYRRIERFSDTNDPHMGMAGPISITRGDPNSSVLNVAFLEAAAQAGYVPTDNPNGPNQEGGAVLQRNTIRGERSDVYRGYIQPARNRSNLTIRCGVRAEKILVEDGRASGVVYRDGGGQHMVSPAREVLLCCGTIASAQLLMLSGIGDPEQIVPHGIALRHELPGVGKNLHTHPAIRVGHETTQPVSLLPWTKPPRKWVAGVEWLLKRTGMAATNHMDAGLWFKTDPALPYADAQITFTPLVLDAGYGDGEIHGFDIYLELVGVRSRGAVTLRSAEP